MRLPHGSAGVPGEVKQDKDKWRVISMSKEYDWNDIKTRIVSIGGAFTDAAISPQLAAYVQELGYEPHPILVDTKGMSGVDVDADFGVVVTYKDDADNNGVYVFVVLRDHSYGLITLLPSTISKAPMIRKVSGDMTNAILSVDHPPLTPFDMVEVAGQVLLNTFIKDIRIAYHIPDEQKEAFLKMYLPKFLVNIAYYYTGAVDKKTGKPMVNEEIADMQPAYIREQLLGNVPEIFQDKPETKPETDTVEPKTDTVKP